MPDVLAKVGGLDLAGLTGVFLGGAMYHIPVLIDGFISSVAALCAVRICPACIDYMLASHCSGEPAGRMILEELGLPFLIDGDMSLGEGSGAVAAVPLARQCTGTEAGRRGFLSAAGQLAAKNNRLQGRHRLSFADADAERPVPVAGRYHHPAD